MLVVAVLLMVLALMATAAKRKRQSVLPMQQGREESHLTEPGLRALKGLEVSLASRGTG